MIDASKVDLRDILRSSPRRDERRGHSENKDDKKLTVNRHIREIEEEQELTLPVVANLKIRKKEKKANTKESRSGKHDIEHYKDTVRQMKYLLSRYDK